MGLFHIAVFLSFTQIVSFLSFGRVLLLGRQPLCTKRLLQANFKINTSHFHKKLQFVFFFYFVLQERLMIYFLYMHLKMIFSHKYLHKKQNTITRNSINRKKTRSAKPDGYSAQQVSG